jgi:hypothetical protein
MKRILLLLLALGLAAPAAAQSPAVCVVSGTVLDGGSNPVVGTQVRFRVVSPVLATTGAALATQDLTTVTAAGGAWSLTLVQGLNAQVDIPAVGIAKDTVIPTGAQCPAAFSSLTLYNRGTLVPATILSTTGPSMGGDLTGSSPNPTVVGLRGQTLAAGNCTNGQARVYSSGSSSYTCQSIVAGTAVSSITGGTGISVTGTATVPIVGISAGGVTSTQLGTGAAAANLGAAGGALTGTYPSPTLAAGVAATNVGALGGDLSGTLPSPSVASVGGQTAANVAAGAVLANAATSANTPSTIVRRDGSNNFTAGTITGALVGNASTASSLSASMTGDASSSGLAVTVLGLRGRPLGNTTPTSNQVLTWTGTQWDAASAVGTVTSVAASGGGTGMSFSGSPIVGAGTLTLQGTLGIGFGGTGATTVAGAFDALSPMSTLGDTIYGGAAGTRTRLAGNTTSTNQFLRSTGSAGLATAPQWAALVSADIPASISSNTSGTAAGLSATLAIGSGGTGQTTAGAAFNALAPTTTTGDLIYANGAGTNTRLAGNTTTTKQYLSSTGTGAAAQAPVWGTIASGDLPATIAANTSGTAAGLSSTLVVASGGTGATTLTGVVHASGTSPMTAGAVALGSEVSGQLPVANGGTGQATAAAGYNALAPTTTLGDLAYANGAGTNTRLAGNTTATKQFLTQTGNGSVSAAPAWGAIAAGDVPNLDASKITTGAFGVAQLPNLAGDVTGTITANTVSKIQGNNFLAGVPSNGQVPQWVTANNRWEPTTITTGGVSSVNGSGGTTGLTLTGGGTGAVTLTLGGTLGIANGGTGAATASSAFSALSPMTTLGDVIYGGASGLGTRLAGNATTTPMFLRSTGTGAAANAPTFSQVNAATDLAGVLPTASGGTNASSWTTGSIPYLSNATTFAQDNTNLFWDGVNHRLGLGTATPVAPLHVAGNAAVTGTLGIGTTSPSTNVQINSATGPVLRLFNTASGFAASLWLQGNTGLGTTYGSTIYHYDFASASGTDLGYGLHFRVGSSSQGMSFGKTTTTTGQDTQADTVWMTLNGTSGALGMGTTTPGAGYTATGATNLVELTSPNLSGTSLILGGSQTADGTLGDLTFGNAAIGTTDNRVGLLRFSRSGANNSGKFDVFTRNAGAFINALTISPAGNVGIGATAPRTFAEIAGAVSPAGFLAPIVNLALTDTTAMAANVGGSLSFLGKYTSGGAFTEFAAIGAAKDNATTGDYGGGLAFYTRTNGSGPWVVKVNPAMFIDSSQRVGIGTAAPAVALDVAGAHDIRAVTAPAAAPASTARLYYDSGAQQLKISQNGGSYVNLLGAGGVSGNGTTDQLAVWTGGTTLGGFSGVVRSSGTGYIGINQGTPGQQLDVNGTVRMEAVAAPGGQANGDTWTDSTQKSLTSVQAGVAQNLSGVVFTQTNSVTVTNTVAETTLMGTGIGTKTLPANFWTVGKTVRFEVSGVIPLANVAGTSYTFKFKCGAVTIPAAAVVGAYPGQGLPWKAEFILTARTIGAGGTVIGQGKIEVGNVGTRFFPMTAVAAIDTTTTGLLDFTVTPTAATALESWMSTNAVITVLN